MNHDHAVTGASEPPLPKPARPEPAKPEPATTALQRANALLDENTPRNTGTAREIDWRFFTTWEEAQFGHTAWPTPEDRVVLFIEQHIKGFPDPVRRRLADAGFPQAATDLRYRLPTLKRRIFTIATKHQKEGCASPIEREAVRRAMKAAYKSEKRRSAKASAFGADAVNAMLDYLQAVAAQAEAQLTMIPAQPVMNRDSQASALAISRGKLRASLFKARRDAALIASIFASGGRRRSEPVAWRLCDITLHRISRKALEVMEIRSCGTKTTDAADELSFVLKGYALQLMLGWLDTLKREGHRVDVECEEPVFRRISKTGTISRNGVSDRSVYDIFIGRVAELRDHLARSGAKPDILASLLEARKISPHSLRAGYITELRYQSISLIEGRYFSMHRSLEVMAGYDRLPSMALSQAGDVLDTAREEANRSASPQTGNATGDRTNGA